jgi:hypothetical protein
VRLGPPISVAAREGVCVERQDSATALSMRASSGFRVIVMAGLSMRPPEIWLASGVPGTAELLCCDERPRTVELRDVH